MFILVVKHEFAVSEFEQFFLWCDRAHLLEQTLIPMTNEPTGVFVDVRGQVDLLKLGEKPWEAFANPCIDEILVPGETLRKSSMTRLDQNDFVVHRLVEFGQNAEVLPRNSFLTL